MAKGRLGLVPLEALYDKLFLSRYLLHEPETNHLVTQTTHVTKFQQILSEL